MRAVMVATLTLGVVAVGSAQPAVGRLNFGVITTAATLEMDKLKGTLSRLAWSDDGTELYVQTLEGAFGRPDARLRHYVFSSSTGKRQDIDAEPAWAAAYWLGKSSQGSPDAPAMKIELVSDQRIEHATAVPRGGDLAKGGTSVATGTAAADVERAAAGAQTIVTHTMKLHGQTIGTFVNAVIVPGLTFGWGPKGSRLIAYTAQKNGRIVVMGLDGKTQELGQSRDAILPAWSRDGERLAWLERDGRHKFQLKIVRID